MMGPWRGSHKLEHDRLGIPDGFASLPANPTVATYYGAFGAGTLFASSVHAAGGWPIVEPFAMPSGGVVESISVVGYGNAGNSGAVCSIRWGVAPLTADPTSPIGLRIGDIIAHGVYSGVNTSEGFVTLAAGQTIAVPPLFCVVLKQGYTTTPAEQFGLRRMSSLTALPGLPAILGGTSEILPSSQLVMTATDYTTGVPAEFASGPIETRYNHRPGVSVKWRAA